MPLAPGARLGTHEILALIGRGGMGEVYRARDTTLNRTVAIKVLGPDSANGPESRRRLLHEARAASALNHPNIVTIHAVEQHGDQSFIVMEHVVGRPLTLPAGGLPLDLGLDLAIEVADAEDTCRRDRERATKRSSTGSITISARSTPPSDDIPRTDPSPRTEFP